MAFGSKSRPNFWRQDRAEAYGLETETETENKVLIGRPVWSRAELSMGWIDLWVGLGWVHYSKSTKILKGLR